MPKQEPEQEPKPELSIAECLQGATEILLDAQTTQQASADIQAQAQSQALALAQEDAQNLLGFVLGKNKAYLFAFADEKLKAAQSELFSHLVQRSAQGEPIAYITGSQGFWDLELEVSPATLIPRPDTETLVEQTLSLIENRYLNKRQETIQLIDLGTGSGAIALALASSLKPAIARQSINISALDYSNEALAIAKQNQQKLSLDAHFIHGSWLDAIADESLDIIVSNPPYIDATDPHLAQLTHEPITALVADDNGLSDYKIIAKQAFSCLKACGLLIVEHGYEQAEALKEIFRLNGFKQITCIKDYGGNDRVTYGFKNLE